MSSPAVLYQAGVHGSRPANGSGCVLYSCTTHNLVYRDDGTSWTTFMTLVGGAGGDIATDTLWDAAGDLAVGSGANTAAKLAKGTALQVLRVNSGATNLEWATQAAAVGNLWTMNKSSSQTLTSNTLTQITFDTTVIDGGGSVIDLANERFTAPATGLYLVIARWIWETTVPLVGAHISIKVGSTESVALARADAATLGANGSIGSSGALSLTSGDFVTMWCHPQGAVTPTARGNASVHLATTFSLVRIT